MKFGVRQLNHLAPGKHLSPPTGSLSLTFAMRLWDLLDSHVTWKHVGFHGSFFLGTMSTQSREQLKKRKKKRSEMLILVVNLDTHFGGVPLVFLLEITSQRKVFSLREFQHCPRVGYYIPSNKQSKLAESWNTSLVGGFNPPIWKIFVKNGFIFPKISGWKFQKYLSCHDPDLQNWYSKHCQKKR